MFTIGEGLALNARRFPHRPALIVGDETLTYRQLDQRVNQAAHALASLGVAKGDRVALLLPNGLAMAELLLATAKLGAVAVPVNVRLAPPELAYVLAHADPRAAVVDGEIFDRLSTAPGTALPASTAVAVAGEGGPSSLPRYASLRDASPSTPPEVEVDGPDPWVLVYTSGTTGRPKGALRSHRSNVFLALTLATDFGIGGEDRGMLLGPMFHVNAIWILSLTLYIGGTCILYPHRTFHPVRMAEEMVRTGTTFAVFVPTLLSYLVEMAHAGHLNGHRLRVLLCSSAPLTSTLRDAVLRTFPQAALFELYGSTEAGAVTHVRHGPDTPVGTVGFPALAQEVRILREDGSPAPVGEVGEVFTRGPTLMDGYYKDPEATHRAMRDGFFSAGDMGRLDQEGRLYLLDRKADMIITMGENVYPTEVEEVIAQAPGVAYVAVVGVPDERRGEAVRAFVVPKPGEPPPDVETIQRLCREQLADYKRPRQIDIVEALPLGPTGKVLRRAVREPFWAGRERRI